MAKKIYVGVNGVARKGKKAYYGVDNIARKVKKIYIGVNGVARCCFSSNELSYYGTVSSLSSIRGGMGYGSVGGYALFAGGYQNTYSGSTLSVALTPRVDTYSSSLTKGLASSLSASRYNMGSGRVGDYLLFAGGATGSGSYPTPVTYNVDAFNTALTKSNPTILNGSRYRVTGASVGDYILFAGGVNSSDYAIDDVEAYNSSLTKTYPTKLSWTAGTPVGASVGNYALFHFGDATTVNAYDMSLTRSLPATSADRHYYCGSATIGNYAVFAGGLYNQETAVVDAYNTSLTRSTATALSVARGYLAGVANEHYALFAGGMRYGSESYNTVDVYDTSLTRSTTTGLSVARFGLAGACAGNYMVFAGGSASGTTSSLSVAEAYLVSD